MLEWLIEAQIRPCIYCDDRPKDVTPSLLVIHNISLPAGRFGEDYVDKLFTGQLDCSAHPSFLDLRGIKVSAHCYIQRDGSIKQYVPFTKRAWHAGVSSFLGVERCNDFSIGIELEGTDDLPYESTQYDTLIKISKIIMRNYPDITLERIVGHCDIAPDRKTDPGPSFDWEAFKCRLKKSEKKV